MFDRGRRRTWPIIPTRKSAPIPGGLCKGLPVAEYLYPTVRVLSRCIECLIYSYAARKQWNDLGMVKIA
jgi:hypothetical protein